jgi:prepilin-type N-terminal cleavage/methylation domain-containing protein
MLNIAAKKSTKKGFTLLELLIVIAIIAILAVIIILVLDPAETLKKSRDSQRLSDLSTIKTALGIYLTSQSTPYLAGANNDGCKGTASLETPYDAADKIYFSVPLGTVINDPTLDGGTLSVPSAAQVLATASGLTDGNGWIPVNLSAMTSGSPISNFPVDPVNTRATGNDITSADLMYRYACNQKKIRFEIDAQLESTAYTVDDDKRAKDGGNNASYYEVGTDLGILGTGTDF